MAGAAQDVGPMPCPRTPTESVVRRVCGDALEEGTELLELLREVRPTLCDGDRLIIVCKAFGWGSDMARSSLLAAFVTCCDESGGIA